MTEMHDVRSGDKSAGCAWIENSMGVLGAATGGRGK
jgi:hypothetical protein